MGKFCTNCGDPRSDGGKFCSNCGAAFPTESAIAAEPIPVEATTSVAAGGSAEPAPVPVPAPAASPSELVEPPPPTGPPIAVNVAPAAPGAASGFVDRVKQLTGLERVQVGSAVAAIVAVFLPWLRSSSDSADAWDVPSLFLLGDETTDRGVKVAVLVLIASVVALVSLVIRTSASRTMLLGAAIAITSIGALFLIQVNRAIQMSTRSFTDVIGIGPLVLVAAGIALLVVSMRLRDRPPTSIG
ncbi:MAG: hypothetical protein ACE37B_13880 [Ilumatobacter sp.]|uniref:zinc ribbon domain-containing protein n=1 Tax=Ilumatobacter sp. TaxID=1967498 RepID=UPI00391B48C2